jgi:predicted nucleotidyltransferase component of viral defense system
VRVLKERNIHHYAQASQVDALVAERDVVLTYVLKVLCEEKRRRPLLHRLALKGGTCLKKVYLGRTGRFSMDLDFTGIGVELDDFKERLHALLDGKEYYGIRFLIDEEFSRRDDTILSYGAVVSYSHSWSSGTFQMEVSLREEPSLGVRSLPLLDELYFRYCEFKPFRVPCLQKEELMAEKIRAAFQRLRSRDLYDLYVLAKTPYNKSIVRALAVLKCWNVREPFNPELFLDRVANGDYDWSDLKRLVRPRQLPAEKDMIEAVVSEYSYLRELDEGLKRIVADSKAHRHPGAVRSLTERLVGYCRSS